MSLGYVILANIVLFPFCPVSFPLSEILLTYSYEKQNRKRELNLGGDTRWPRAARKLRSCIMCCWECVSEGLQRRSSTCWRTVLGVRSREVRSDASAWPKKWGLSREPCGRTVHVSRQEWRLSGSVQVKAKAKRSWESGCKGMVKKASLKPGKREWEREHRGLGLLGVWGKQPHW